MKKFLSISAAVLGLAIFGPDAATFAQTTDQTRIILAQKGSRSSCCQAQYSQCSAFCRSTRPGPSCWGDCDSRLSACKASGTFRWNNRPSVQC